ncbi:MAG: oxygen-independent coproporphyrinogen III oxidase [Phenylobacterium zucineum]|nr:MAG: oxygen-independent coproporphyrinogen III oxidase [Phenylobacterium zucineum]
MPALAKAKSQPLSRAALIAKYDGRAPRYTSYPTAVQFTPDVNAEIYRSWLGDLSPKEAVSLYLHIPFCSRLCWYCGCNTRAVNRHEPVRDYVTYLLREADMLADALPGRMKADAIHLGGGTPNMLTPDELDLIFGALRTRFDLSSEAEIAAELDPEILTQDWVKAAAANGLNRASLGVQNLAPEVQAAVNRVEHFSHIADCVSWLRGFGVGSINMDLMYGLPKQTVANTLNTVREILTVRPERLALFGYAHVPWMKSHQQLIKDEDLPCAAARLDQSEAAAELLVGEGYVRIGLDHFALPQDTLCKAQAEGRMHRNFQGYTTDAAKILLGLGASAIGNLPQGFTQNIAQELGWRAAIDKGNLPIARGVALTDDDSFRGEIIEKLMCDFKVDLAEVCARHGRNLADLASTRPGLADLAADGLLILNGDRLIVTEGGKLVVRTICALFDIYFAPEGGRHSKAL